MQVLKTYQGQLPTEVELFDDGMCDGPVLRVGREYLLYTWRTSGGGIPARGCSRSRAIEDAAEDLRFLKDYEPGASRSRIAGRVVQEFGSMRVWVQQQLTVVVSNGRTSIRTKTNADGEYSTPKFSPGTYKVRIDQPGNKVRQDVLAVEVGPKACTVANLELKLE